MARKPGKPLSQSTAIKRLESLAKKYGYNTTLRKKDAKQEAEKTFLPDLIADPVGKSKKRVFEVEKTVTNNTIFKSLASLLSFMRRNKGSFGFIVVPDKHHKFVEECKSELTKIIRFYSKSRKGAPTKIRLQVIGFNEVSNALKIIEEWEELPGKKRGPRPKCEFFPKGW